mmetsp:Transcript_3773/g.7908  ORF Transcript_3773/g.7908 Transcript_3773/m.7908 type:complete len:167 (+) Transcript_3773:1148-1648(+)
MEPVINSCLADGGLFSGLDGPVTGTGAGGEAHAGCAQATAEARKKKLRRPTAGPPDDATGGPEIVVAGSESNPTVRGRNGRGSSQYPGTCIETEEVFRRPGPRPNGGASTDPDKSATTELLPLEEREGAINETAADRRRRREMQVHQQIGRSVAEYFGKTMDLESR